MDDVCSQLFEEVTQCYAEHKQLSDELLAALHFVFRSPILLALDLTEKNSVSRIYTESGRAVYQVLGSSGNPYICFKDSNYCSCPAFKFSVLKREEHIMCKHVLALRLSEAIGVTKQQLVTEAEMNAITANMY